MLSPSSSRTFVRVAFLAFVAVLASLLTARYKLEETPYNRPFGNVVALGHQANQIAFSRTVASSTAANAGQVDAATGTDGGSGEGAELSTEWDDDEGEDEWDVWGALSAETATQSGWDPLAANTAPFTELQVKTCVLSPGLYDMCSPTSTAKEDAARGKWERIDRDVSKKAGIYYLYLYARRLLPGSTAPVITDLRLLDHRPDAEELTDDGTWVEVSTSVRDGVWPRMKPLFLHYKLTPQADIFAARKAEGSNGSAGKLEPITELDVLYGGTEVHPLPGFTKLEPPVSGGEDDDERAGTGTGKGKRIGASLAYRKEQTSVSFRLLLAIAAQLTSSSLHQSSRRRPCCVSTTRATSLSSRPPTCTSRSGQASAATSTRSASASAARSARTSTASSGSRRRLTRSSPTSSC